MTRLWISQTCHRDTFVLITNVSSRHVCARHKLVSVTTGAALGPVTTTLACPARPCRTGTWRHPAPPPYDSLRRDAPPVMAPGRCYSALSIQKLFCKHACCACKKFLVRAVSARILNAVAKILTLQLFFLHFNLKGRGPGARLPMSRTCAKFMHAKAVVTAVVFSCVCVRVVERAA